MKIFFTLGILLLGSIYTQAQTTTNEIVKEWERAKAYTEEYLDAMPESGYALKPTPEMRSFAEQMLHLTETDYVFVSAATGAKSPLGMESLEKTPNRSKNNVKKLVMEGYDFAINAIKNMTPEQLNEPIKLFGSFNLSKGMVLQKSFEHQTHQRGQSTVYLHLAGVKPPQEKLF